MPNRKSVISRILLAVYLLGLFVCCFWNFRSSIDLSQDWWLPVPFDKTVHFFLFLPFPFICYLAFPRFSGSRKGKYLFVLAAFLVGTMLGAGIEILQELSGYRSGDPMDLLADCTGLALASTIILILDLCPRKNLR